GEEEGERGDGGLKYCVLGRERPHLLGGLRPRSRRSQYLREGFPHRRSRVEQTTQGWCGRSPAQRRQSSPRARRRPRYACCSRPGIGFTAALSGKTLVASRAGSTRRWSLSKPLSTARRSVVGLRSRPSCSLADLSPGQAAMTRPPLSAPPASNATVAVP